MNFITINNPNKDKSVKETPTMNYISKFLRTKSTFTNLVKEEHFEIHFICFIWEWIIDTNNGSRFVIQEYKVSKNNTTLQIYYYKNANDIRETKRILCEDVKSDDKSALNLLKIINFINLNPQLY